ADHKRALDYFKQATDSDPNYAEAFFNLGLSYMQLKDSVKATKAFEQALTLEPGSAEPYTQLGAMYLQQGKRAQAVEAFKRSIELTDAEDKEASKFHVARKWTKLTATKRTSDAYKGLAMAYLGLGR